MNESVCWQFRQGSSEMARLWPTWCWLGSFPCLQPVGRSAGRGLVPDSLIGFMCLVWLEQLGLLGLSLHKVSHPQWGKPDFVHMFTVFQKGQGRSCKTSWGSSLEIISATFLLSELVRRPACGVSFKDWPAATLCNIIALGLRARFLTFWTSISSSFKM